MSDQQDAPRQSIKLPSFREVLLVAFPVCSAAPEKLTAPLEALSNSEATSQVLAATDRCKLPKGPLQPLIYSLPVLHKARLLRSQGRLLRLFSLLTQGDQSLYRSLAPGDPPPGLGGELDYAVCDTCCSRRAASKQNAT